MQALVQLRGDVNMDTDIHDTLKMLNIHHVNHCTLVPDTETYNGMVSKVNDFVAFGEPSQETIELLLSTRAEPAEGDADVDDEWVAENTEFDDIEGLAWALVSEETTLQEQGLSPTLRLHPPRGGHDGIKHPTKEGGELGRHDTEGIDALLEAMR
ncbi:50S ribosomal protein L30 [Haloarcula salinisoli]|uniref:Large ribosomal subunit protein uL30 n=1 Tax=Haloarcula salinisoli TaxID=2487746 RepID=A0A8J7YF63_9EURY|nr:50S ribosomal protein L30 [Halomicroarcula salinisoli]MBX0287478.1 50S ribosomal protein L30 [Halomicroarcula salinisoli]MBX0304950.1 50S ribosomal protein L30 [Halomicroarcula salinisoli]